LAAGGTGGRRLFSPAMPRREASAALGIEDETMTKPPKREEAEYFTLRDPPGFYALEKLVDAVHALGGPGSVQKRLGDAAICLIMVRPNEVPDGESRRMLSV
jgi:hypothetical protein